MFEGLRKSSQSLMLIILIASLATMFGVTFGPGRGGCNANTLRVNFIAGVYGTTISEVDYQSSMRVARGIDESVARVMGRGLSPQLLRQAVFNGLVERELLAHEAERLGYAISEDALDREIRDGHYYESFGQHDIGVLASGAGLPVGLFAARQTTSYARRDPTAHPGDPPPEFAYADFDAWVRSTYSRTVPDYRRLMSREMLAEQMRNVVLESVRVSEDEVWRDYQRQHNQVTLRYIDFSPDFYRGTVRSDDRAAIDAWAAAHASDVNDLWTARHASLQHLPAQVRFRQLFLRFPEDTDPARIATDQRAEYLHAQIVAPAGDFVRMARLYSQDDATWRSGGESEWSSVDRLTVPDDVKRALATLPPGQVSAPIRTATGVYIVQLLGRREGDVTEADGKADIARELYVQATATAATQAAATHAQGMLGEAGATLDSVGAQVHLEALHTFYRGDVPAAITLPGNNTLEPVGDRDAGVPDLRETQPFTRNGSIPGISDSEPLMAAAFHLTEANPAPSVPIAIGEERFIIRLKDHGRQEASRDEFNHDRQRLMDSYALPRRREALLQYIDRLRTDAERAGQIRIGNSPLLVQTPAAGSHAPQGAG